jgi:hypothetical protein
VTFHLITLLCGISAEMSVGFLSRGVAGMGLNERRGGVLGEEDRRRWSGFADRGVAVSDLPVECPI